MTEPRQAFDDADYYSCSEDAETLEHESPTAAIEYLIDEVLPPKEPIVQALDAVGDVTVCAWRRKAVTEQFWLALGIWAGEKMQEDFDEEYGGGDDNVLVRMGVHEDTLARELADVFRLHVTNGGTKDPVRQCEMVGKRVYTRAEVEALMREENPGWFE